MKEGSKDVGAYIKKVPKKVQQKLKRLRSAIKEIAPNSEESISYMMPSFDKGRIAWFALMKNYIGLYIRPPIIKEHGKELRAYKTTKSAIHFPLDKELPIPLIKRLVKARIKKNKDN